MNLAVLGYGTVGKGVCDIAESRRDLNVKYVLVRSDKPELGDKAIRDFNTILEDPFVDTVVEVMGGLHPSYEYAVAAIKAGKNFVTANKYLVCHHFNELTNLARRMGVALRYTAAAGGGIPWLINLERARRADRILAINGIINGTTNYILDTMLNSELDFAECLSQAQALGYAEADPTDDVEGRDVQRKLILSTKLAFDSLLTEEQVPICGIVGINREDLSNFERAGKVCKLIATAKRIDDGVCAYVEPTLLADDAPEAAVHSNFNFVTLEGRTVGRLSFFGQGAGRYPTAFNIIQDCLDILTDVAPEPWAAVDSPVYDTEHRYYVRTARPDAWLNSIVDRKIGTGYVTKPVSMQQMHRWIKEQKTVDPACFMAGIPEE